MPAVPPSEFPPPFDPRSVIGPPTDAPEDRIEVGVAIVGGGPAGLRRTPQGLPSRAERPGPTEKLGEVPVAVIEKGKVAVGSVDLIVDVTGWVKGGLFPDLPKEDWPV